VVVEIKNLSKKIEISDNLKRDLYTWDEIKNI
jgi:hypothetical protein